MAKNELDQDIADFDAPDLSQEAIAGHYANLLAAAIDKTGAAEVVEIKSALGQIHLLCRVKKEKQAEWVHKIGYRMLLATRSYCEFFFGSEYFIKGPDDKMRYGWIVSCGSKDIREAVSRICLAIDEAAPRMEVLEAPLLGPGTPAARDGKRGAALVR